MIYAYIIKRLDHYPNIIGKDSYYHMSEVIDSMRDLYEDNVFLTDVIQIRNYARQNQR